MKAASRIHAPHHDNVIRVPAERWRAKRLRSDRAPERPCAPVTRIRYDDDTPDDDVPKDRPARPGRMPADATFYILVREVTLRDPKTRNVEDVFWDIGTIPLCTDEDLNGLALRNAHENGWHPIRERTDDGYPPKRFSGAMSTRGIRREALRRCEALSRTFPGYDDPARVEEMLTDANVLPLSSAYVLPED
ncbi:hypothetical protein L0Y59_03715 [Candidatus Uhrbacteria bacterium]|nr:hypothetical protein [Candidatus Uhrbacteria bacterium]